jgi:hypothetical protein
VLSTACGAAADPVRHQTRLATGYDLEGTFSDGYLGSLLREQMAPFYQSGQVAEGVEATVELLVARAIELASPHDLNGGDVAPNYRNRWRGRQPSRGGCRIRPAGDAGAASRGPLRRAVDGRGAAFAVYLNVLRTRDRRADLGIYSKATTDWLRARPVTVAQQRNELAAIEAVYATRTVREQGGLAVISFRNAPLVPPYLLRREGTGWTIDLASAGRAFGFDHLNRWFVRDKNTEYAFGL